MKKIFLLVAVLGLTACATGRKETEIVTLLSYEKYTDIFINNELVGISHTQTKLPYKNIKNTIISGRKKGCKTTELKAEYEFDYPMLFNPTNILYVPEKYFSWDWWRPSKQKVMYNVTPVCD